MLKDSKAFSSYSVNDLDKAQEFYSQVLGLDVQKLDMGVLQINFSQGGSLMIYPKPDHKPAAFTVLNFHVTDIDQMVDELTQKGVSFEHYDMEYIKTDEKGISRGAGRAMAWFTDPAGNIISLIEEEK